MSTYLGLSSAADRLNSLIQLYNLVAKLCKLWRVFFANSSDFSSRQKWKNILDKNWINLNEKVNDISIQLSLKECQNQGDWGFFRFFRNLSRGGLHCFLSWGLSTCWDLKTEYWLSPKSPPPPPPRISLFPMVVDVRWDGIGFPNFYNDVLWLLMKRGLR